MLFTAIASIFALGPSFTCTPVRVYDGSGPIWCAEGPKVRLWGIAVRELDNSCRPTRACPKVTGVQSRDYLVQLLGGAKGVTSSGHTIVAGPVLSCEWLNTNPQNGKTNAWCRAPRIGDLSCAMVRGDHAALFYRHGGDKVCRLRDPDENFQNGSRRERRGR